MSAPTIPEVLPDQVERFTAACDADECSRTATHVVHINRACKHEPHLVLICPYHIQVMKRVLTAQVHCALCGAVASYRIEAL